MDTKETRRQNLTVLEAARSSRVITYVTGDRRGAETRIGMDVFPYFYSVLQGVGHVQQIDLLLYSAGGSTMAAWGLVNLIREFCDRFCVLIPFKAQSSATLMSLGADEIVMGPMAQLSPVDPSITSPFNPTGTLPGQVGTQQVLPISVEDVTSYLDLAREEANIKAGPAMIEVFKKLSDTVQPMALGSVYRAKTQIKLLARKLLAFHMDEQTDKTKIDSIIKSLTKELYSHDYLISRREAKTVLKLKVTNADANLEGLMWKTLESYAEAMEMNTPYNPAAVVGSEEQKTISLDGAFIEGTARGYTFRTTKEVRRLGAGQIPGAPGAIGFQEQVLKQGWEAV